ncbi:MAG TPA: VOC family protein [Acidimicrobiales bacterium]|nr:VOC family protein [Acidimicrobiales bacterium]
MRVQSLGHVVLKVRDLTRSEAFYSGVLGIAVISRISHPVHMTFFTLGNHHDFAIIEVEEDAPSPDPRATGLAHVAFKIGETLEDFDSMRSHLDSAGIGSLYTAERALTTSLHLLDPDGNEVELYIDTSDNWKANALAGT